MYFAGGSPDLAYVTGEQVSNKPKYSLKDYIRATKSPLYTSIKEELEKQYNENFDGLLLGQLHSAQQAMAAVSVDHPNYKDVTKRYLDIFKLTAPIIERLAKKKIELDIFTGLELVVKGVDGE